MKVTQGVSLKFEVQSLEETKTTSLVPMASELEGIYGVRIQQLALYTQIQVQIYNLRANDPSFNLWTNGPLEVLSFPRKLFT